MHVACIYVNMPTHQASTTSNLPREEIDQPQSGASLRSVDDQQPLLGVCDEIGNKTGLLKCHLPLVNPEMTTNLLAGRVTKLAHLSLPPQRPR